MDSFDKALCELSEKELLVLSIRTQANILHRLKRLENIASLIQEHLLPRDVEDFYKGTGGTCGTFIEMLSFASRANCGNLGENEEVNKLISDAVNEIKSYKEKIRRKE